MASRTAACGALRSFVSSFVDWVEQRPGRAAGGAQLRRPSLRSGCTAVRARGARRELTSLASRASFKHALLSQCTKRAARAAPRAVLLVAAEIAPPAAHPGRCERPWSVQRANRRAWAGASRTPTGVCKDAAGRRAQRLCGGEERRVRGRARSADRELTWSRLVERSERSKRSEFRDPAPEPSTTAQSDRREDRRSEAEPAARSRLCSSKKYRERTSAVRRQQTPLLRPSL